MLRKIKGPCFCLGLLSLSLLMMAQARAQEVNFGAQQQQTAPAASAPPSTQSNNGQTSDPNAPPEKGYSQYYQAPGVWDENEDLPPPGVDAPPTPVPPAPGDPGSDAATPVGNQSMAPTQGAPDPEDDPNADNGGMMSAAAQPAAVSGVGSDHPGMNGP